MKKSIARPADAFLYDDSHSLCASPYSIPLRSDRDIFRTCSGRRVVFIDGGDPVSERLFPVFARTVADMLVVPLQSRTPQELSRPVLGTGGDDLVLVLASARYQQVVRDICSVLSAPVPVVLPTGFFILASPGASYAIQKGACTSYDNLGEMLSRFKGRRLLVWNHGPTARHFFAPALAQLGMAEDLVDFMVTFRGKPVNSDGEKIHYLTAMSNTFGGPDGFCLGDMLIDGKATYRMPAAGQWMVNIFYSQEVANNPALADLKDKCGIVHTAASVSFEVKP